MMLRAFACNGNSSQDEKSRVYDGNDGTSEKLAVALMHRPTYFGFALDAAPLQLQRFSPLSIVVVRSAERFDTSIFNLRTIPL